MREATTEAVPPAEADSTPLFTKKSLCAYLGVSQSTLDRLVSAGKLASCRIGGQVRFRPADVEEFIAAARE
jgi:excisionase family DNA binding protein